MLLFRRTNQNWVHPHTYCKLYLFYVTSANFRNEFLNCINLTTSSNYLNELYFILCPLFFSFLLEFSIKQIFFFVSYFFPFYLIYFLYCAFRYSNGLAILSMFTIMLIKLTSDSRVLKLSRKILWKSLDRELDKTPNALNHQRPYIKVGQSGLPDHGKCNTNNWWLQGIQQQVYQSESKHNKCIMKQMSL